VPEILRNPLSTPDTICLPNLDPIPSHAQSNRAFDNAPGFIPRWSDSVPPNIFCEVYARVRTCPEVSEWLSCPSGHSYLSLGQFMPYVQSIVILCPSRKSRFYFLRDFLSFFDLLNFPLFFRPIKVDFYTLCCIKLYHPTVNDNFNSIVVRFQ